MDVISRRELLLTNQNPETRLDYVVTLGGELIHGEDHDYPSQVRLRYIPDHYTLTPDSFSIYLDRLSDTNWPSLETVATALIDDLNNELVPRWVQVRIEITPHSETPAHFHSVTLEDKQPKWNNPELLARLES
ncbi:MAG: hypothetical protein OQJ97_09135 [Rhodospirillales bacterium]|nr:hypothetical protein [Rhodospirillales bacterium]